MSLRVLPVQFLNLGGEMMYIIDQRLRMQNIPVDKAEKVRNDILATMLKPSFMDEIFRPQKAFTRTALRSVFGKLSHVSLMKMNASSMDKLYDLMVMALKQQLVFATGTHDLLMLTFNHLDSLAAFAVTDEVLGFVKNTKRLFLENFSTASTAELTRIRRSLLAFVQDVHIRVSIFLRAGIQDQCGRFIVSASGPLPPGTEPPGTIKVMGTKDVVRFDPEGDYFVPDRYGSLDIEGERCTGLGTNMYLDEGNFSSLTTKPVGGSCDRPEYTSSVTESRHAREELNLLSQIIGSSAPSTQEVKLCLFVNDEEANFDAPEDAVAPPVITIEGRQRGPVAELAKIWGELEVHQEGDTPHEDSLLDLLDSA